MKPSIGIFGLSGCWGEQIVILNCEDQLLDLVSEVDIADFHGASSAAPSDTPLAIAFVEGSVSSDRDEAALRQIRQRARVLVACGTCASVGGVAAAASQLSHEEKLALVYGGRAGTVDSRPNRPLSDFVTVDLAIPGCPMEKDEFLQGVACLLNGDKPEKRAYPVCAECRMAEHECLLEQGMPCVGSITAAGCGARCPGFNVGCIGCRGPVEDANYDGLRDAFGKLGMADTDIARRLHTFDAPVLVAGAEEIRK
jgi:sulfhydrogenase subunit delta